MEKAEGDIMGLGFRLRGCGAEGLGFRGLGAEGLGFRGFRVSLSQSPSLLAGSC